MLKNKDAIIVSGSHRSGTTWVGNMLSLAEGIHNVHEPFNIGIFRYKSPLNLWFQFVNSNMPESQLSLIRKYLLDHMTMAETKQIGLPYQYKSAKDFYLNSQSVKNKILKKRTLFKDPIALLSLEWLNNEICSNVVVMIRHPAAFVASVKIKEWKHDFSHFSSQKDLMNGPLKSFQQVIENEVQKPSSSLEQAIILWNISYSIVLDYQNKYSGKWQFVVHEKISKDPIKEFKNLYQKLNLKYSDQVEKKIILSTSGEKEKKFQRNSKQNITSWKNRLTPNEIAQIKDNTYPLWTNYYNEDDW